MSYISKLGIFVILCLCLFQSAIADVEIGTGDVYFTDSNIILEDGQIVTNITALSSSVLIYDGAEYINFSASENTQITALNFETGEGTERWVFDAAATSGTLTIVVKSEFGRLYDFLVDTVLKGTGYGSFTYNEWSSHSFIIRATTGNANIFDWLNSATNNKALKPMVSEGQSVDFDILGFVGDGTITFHWYKNGVDQTTNNARFTTLWSNWGDTAEITCYISDDNGDSANLTWTPYIVRARASSTPLPVDTARSNEFINATDDMDIESMLAAELYLFTDLMGAFVYLVFIGIPMVMIYVRTDSLIIPAVISVITGMFTVVMLPTAYQVPAVLLILVGITSIIVGLFKERSG